METGLGYRVALLTAILTVSLTAGAATISGTVTDQDGQTPVANLVLILRANDSTVERRTVTDQKGRFVFLGVRQADSYMLNSDNGYPRMFYPDLLKVRPSEHLVLHGLAIQHCGWVVWSERPDPSMKASTYPLERRTNIRICD